MYKKYRYYFHRNWHLFTVYRIDINSEWLSMHIFTFIDYVMK